jgi:hypothetical protein
LKKQLIILASTIGKNPKKLVSNNNFSPGIILHPGIVPHPFEGFETIIPYEELKRETRYVIMDGHMAMAATAPLPRPEVAFCRHPEYIRN